MHHLKQEIILASDSASVWEFLSTPRNLNALTPPDLHFRILSAVPDRMYNGLTILYEIRIPFFGTHRWLTEIKHIEEGSFFVDEQRIGPYRLWYHQHRLERLDNGRTRVVDDVCYKLPWHCLGTLVHKFWVRDMLEQIFDYRARRLAELFG